MRVGDRIIVINPTSSLRGKKGTIDRIDFTRGPLAYFIIFDEDESSRDDPIPFMISEISVSPSGDAGPSDSVSETQ